MGNICRSPAGEAVFRDWARRQGARVEVDSAGTISYHAGDPADPRMRAAASARGYDLNSRARAVVPGDFDRFDLIVAMDRDNLADLSRYADEAESRLALLGDFLPEEGRPDVPDPYYGGAEGFETVLDMIERACPALLERVTGERS